MDSDKPTGPADNKSSTDWLVDPLEKVGQPTIGPWYGDGATYHGFFYGLFSSLRDAARMRPRCAIGAAIPLAPSQIDRAFFSPSKTRFVVRVRDHSGQPMFVQGPPPTECVVLVVCAEALNLVLDGCWNPAMPIFNRVGHHCCCRPMRWIDRCTERRARVPFVRPSELTERECETRHKKGLGRSARSGVFDVR